MALFFLAMERHQNLLKILCRVCAKTVKSYRHDKKNEACSSLLVTAFGTVVASEPDEVYPPSVCHNCYRTLQKIKASKETRVAYQTALSLHEWMPHLEDQHCPVCCHDIQHKKPKPQGRPCNKDIIHLSRVIMRRECHQPPSIHRPSFERLSLLAITNAD